MDIAALGARYREAARTANHRRLVVLAGDRDAGRDAAVDLLAGAGVADDAATLVSTRGGVRFERLPPARADRLLGTTRAAVVVDAHEGFSPNLLGQVVGAVDGGGLLVLLTPPLEAWPSRRDGFDRSLAVPPFGVGDVTGRFRRRLVGTLRDHPGVSVVDVDAGAVVREAEAPPSPLQGGVAGPVVPDDHAFPRAAYETCLTGDQSRAVAALERLRDPDEVVVVEADRGRGKSSAAGLAAGSLAAAGRDVLVTAPAAGSAAALFDRAVELLGALDALAGADDAGDAGVPNGSDDGGEPVPVLRSPAGGRVRFAPPTEAAALPGDPDVVFVDEAAALPVRLLERLLDAPAAGFVTTVHGYEGAGRGFSVRFRDRLAGYRGRVTDVRMDDPVRYDPGDPVETWAFRALLLDARPAVDQLVADAEPESCSYRTLAPADLLADEHRLREAFGLLVLAHYRTEPNDLARLLDAPNLTARALLHDGHVVSVALLAREGGLDAETRAATYDGARIRGQMLPDVLTSQLRDEAAGVPVGYRVVRVATHHAARSRGLGSRLLAEAAAEFDGEADWLGVGYGATPELLRFWDDNGYDAVHLSTTRNDASGEYSALMLRPLSPSGRELRDRHAEWFARRVGGVCSDPLRDADPDVVRATLGAIPAAAAPDPGLSPPDWRVVAGAAYGPGVSDVAPDAFRRLAVAHLIEGRADLDADAERLLVAKALQARPWDAVADEFGYVSRRVCMRSYGEAYRSLVDVYGDATARAVRERYEGG
jgi:tRNA(Met) cytidine acetyltransferase